MRSKRLIYCSRKHKWGLSSSKARKLATLYDQIELERVEPYKVELTRVKVTEKV